MYITYTTLLCDFAGNLSFLIPATNSIDIINGGSHRAETMRSLDGTCRIINNSIVTDSSIGQKVGVSYN